MPILFVVLDNSSLPINNEMPEDAVQNWLVKQFLNGRAQCHVVH